MPMRQVKPQIRPNTHAMNRRNAPNIPPPLPFFRTGLRALRLAVLLVAAFFLGTALDLVLVALARVADGYRLSATNGGLRRFESLMLYPARSGFWGTIDRRGAGVEVLITFNSPLAFAQILIFTAELCKKCANLPDFYVIYRASRFLCIAATVLISPSRHAGGRLRNRGENSETHHRND